jgi:hypothetical protein
MHFHFGLAVLFGDNPEFTIKYRDGSEFSFDQKCERVWNEECGKVVGGKNQ